MISSLIFLNFFPFQRGKGEWMNANVLIVDDEPNAIKVLSAILSGEGYNVYKSFNVEKAVKIISHESMDAVITDLRMPDRDGMQFFEYLKENHPDVPVIFLTAYGTVESAVQTITRGAYYYFIKPPDYAKLKGILSKAVEEHRLKKEISPIADSPLPAGEELRIIGRDQQMQRMFEIISAIKDTKSSVLITGETGTGKELIAKALHFSSMRKERPFIAMNCAAIPRDLMESELFGYEKGAFTSAVSKRVGRFEEAAGGTIFLDEIGEIEISLQAKLLRVLQEREIERLGSNRKVKVDFRLISSTNRDLEKEVETGAFRRDLYYRINVVQLRIPPLRERRDDVPLLVDEFIKEICRREKKSVMVSEEVMKLLAGYNWPGNIRQLKNVVERLVVLARGSEITPLDLPEELLAAGEHLPEIPAPVSQLPTLKELEVNAIRNTLEECRGNKSKAAKLLGISRKTFYKRLKEM
jgi:DNA-binding NtrC family response regulator